MRRLAPSPALHFALILALPFSCQPLSPTLAPQDRTPLSAYRDSALDISVNYPTGWVPDSKSVRAGDGITHDVYFEAPDMLWTRRFAVKVIDRSDSLSRTLEDYRRDFLDQLEARKGNIGGLETGSATLAGEPGYRATYRTYLGGEPQLRVLEVIARHRGRDYGLSFEAGPASEAGDMLLFERVAREFRFYRP